MKIIIAIVFVNLFLLNSALASTNLQFKLRFLKFDYCENQRLNSSLNKFMNQIEKILPWIDTSVIRGNFNLNAAERTYVYFNPSAAPSYKVFKMADDKIKSYCYGYSPGSPLNAILHFSISATITHLYGEKVAKEVMDLHEAGLEFNFVSDRKTIAGDSAMDIYNNYVGIEWGTQFRAIPDDRDPLEFFIKEGVKLYQEGKLKSIRPLPSEGQRCLIPKEKFQGPPHRSYLGNPYNDKRVSIYYDILEIPKQTKVPTKNILTKEDIASVVNNSDPSADPLFIKMEQYRTNLVGTCCE